MPDERFHRPDLPRTGPYRDFANILRSAGGVDAEPDAAREAPGATGGFVSEGVRAAYQVAEAYLREGERVARTLGVPSYDPLGSGNLINDLSARWIQASAELMAIGFEVLGSVAANAGYPTATRPQGPGGTVPQPSGPIAVHYEIVSNRPARVWLEFQPGQEHADLASDGLRSLEPAHAPIPVEFEPQSQSGCVLVRITVPEKQPPDFYTGAVLRADTSRCIGTLNLVLQ